MKTLIIAMMIIQVLLIIYGVYEISIERIQIGCFLTIFNSFCLGINIRNL